MGRGEYLFTSESVSEGHPDKVCDRISDAVVDAYLAKDSNARVACETLVTTNRVVLAGEVRGPESITAEALASIARTCVREIGYEQDGFHWAKAAVEVHVHAQSADIALRRGSGRQQGPGAPAIRASCSAMPAARPMPSCRRRSTMPTRSWRRLPAPGTPTKPPASGPIPRAR